MIELVDKLEAMINSGNILWLILLIPVAIAFNLKHLSAMMETWEFKRKLGVKRLTEANECKNLDDDLKQFIKRELQHEYFAYITGLSVGENFRKKLLEIHLKTHKALPFVHFKRAFSFLRFENNALSVKISWLDTVGYYFNWFVAITSFVFMMLSFFGVFLLPEQTMKMIVFVVVFGTYSFLFVFNNRAYWSAKKIKELLVDDKPPSEFGGF